MVAELSKFKVLRDHEGDKPYTTKDTRIARDDDVRHLVEMGVLKKIGPANTKAESKPGNKAETAPANKSHRR